MNYRLISALVKGTWAIDENYALGHMNIVAGLLAPGAIVTEMKVDEDQLKMYAIDRDTHQMRRYDKSWQNAPKNSIAVIPIVGPLMREDNDCGTVGMDTLAQVIQSAAAHEHIKGILLVVDTPGGSVDGTINLSNVISKVEKPIGSYIKGMMCSAGVWINAGTKFKIAETGLTEVGSVGVITSIIDYQPYLEKEGVKFHNILANESPNKRRHWEQIRAGNYEDYKKEVLSPIAQEFIKTVKANYPGVNDEQLKGDVFYAQDVIGSFVDKIGDFDVAIVELNRLIDEQTPEIIETNSNNYAMKKQYLNVNSALAIDALECEIEGVYLTEEQVEALDTAIGNAKDAEKRATEAKANFENQLSDKDKQLKKAEADLALAHETNKKLSDQIENGGSQKPAGADVKEEPIGDIEKTLADMPHIKAAQEKLRQ